MLSDSDLTALWLTVKLALITTGTLLLLGIPLAWWLARTSCRFKFLLDAVIALPLVLPPTVLGFYLLFVLGPKGPFGDTSLAFTFTGLIVGSVIYSLPFVVQPIQNAFAAIRREHLEVASTLGSSAVRRFFTIALPLARPGILTGAVLGFAHTLGEFGVVLMIGGNIPGSTRVVSIAIYDHVEGLNYGDAHRLSLVLLCLSFLMLIFVYGLHRKKSLLLS
ncbi:MAG: molybdate ABC transporter permease subunit [Verrucomicrobiales bacterium]|nr:molybdate ABC transporter permease subunit [Verrucomicrobiales bacterium]